ncbi:hypothetical protein [Lentibacillus cibarius]|uniref:Uncharacterized protein n=1 Tax=Lentibacillus cibarius TaxID=2583219 RepID=A0A5S3QGZ0_9BACI|nr:hypothetical protein [Lentibacillus cibarius]TMN21162.1 hypothetical protein FFL34_02840 [Lentibacillus cibarius]
MLVINRRRLRDVKIAQLKEGKIAYAESAELIRLIKRSIERENLHVYYDETNTGCWFTPIPTTKSS